MKLKISPRQLDILKSHCIIVENGLHSNDTNLITEAFKRFRVRLLINGFEFDIEIGCGSAGTSLAVAKRLFPQAMVTGSAKQVK